MTQCCLHLSHDEPLACLLRLAVLVLDHLPEVGDGLFVLSLMDIVVGIGLVPVVLCAIVDGVATGVAHHILGIVYPVQLRVTVGQPGTGQSVDGRLRLIQTAHIAEGGGSLVELTLLELRLTHEQPRLPQEGVVLAPAQPLAVFVGLTSALLPFGLGLDAVLLDGLLHLLHGAVEVTTAYLPTLLVSNGVEGQHLGEVVLVAFLLFQRSVDIGQ